MNSITNLSAAELRQAANIQERIQSLQRELRRILGATVESGPSEAPRKGRRKMSASGLANIRAAQRARWAKIRGKAPKRKLSAQAIANIRAGVAKRMATQGKARIAKPTPKRKMSAAAKARLSALAKARWAKVRAAGKTKL
jgi:hypothetical protein